MLQQTRIEAVKEYYQKFIKELPNIQSLAQVKEDKLLKLWEGLGYYSRARNLKKAAQIIEEKYQGKFPKTYTEIKNLPGIGEYTASAISSICFGEKQATIDGNVLRVYTRFYNDNRNIDERTTRKEIRKELMNFLPNNPGEFNESLMEIGETICIPKGTPLCKKCPLQKNCQAKRKNTINKLPVRKEKQEKQEKKYTVLLFCYQDTIIIQKRKGKGLLENLWEIPNVEGHLSPKKVKELLKKEQIIPQKIEEGISSTHIFTHQKWHMISYKINLTSPIKEKSLSLNIIKKDYAIPTAFQPFIKEIEKELNQKTLERKIV